MIHHRISNPNSLLSPGGADGGTLAFSSISSLAESLLASASGAVGGLESTAAAGLVDMPVDPNEPTYCLCQQVSYGSMIACDSPEVVIGTCYHVLILTLD